MPLGDLNIKEVILEVLYVLKVFLEEHFQLSQILSNFRAFGASEYWHKNLGAFSSKLELTFTDFL
jgi:hypothetical protein